MIDPQGQLGLDRQWRRHVAIQRLRYDTLVRVLDWYHAVIDAPSFDLFEHGVDRSQRLADVGVAGLHRLLASAERLRSARVVIVVAGMEGALPSVVGGLISAPVVAVPTSVGYGASFGGLAALLAMLNSCAAGVTVVNIDNGFGAAAAASRICSR